MQSLATQVRKQLHASRVDKKPVQGFNFSTATLMSRFLEVFGSLSLSLMTSTIVFITYVI